MDRRLPPTVGAIAALAVLVALLAPYVALSSQAAAALGTYYRFGVAGAWGVGLLALVSLVAFAGGRQGRTDPDVVAGATLVAGLAATVGALQWAVAVDPEVVQSVGRASWLSTHRWVVVALSAALPATAGWYARAIGLV